MPTNQQLRQLLLDLGFQPRKSVEPQCLVFEHGESNARFIMPSNKDDEMAREADILSIRTHLMYRGLLNQTAFEEFLKVGVLKAS